MPESLPPNLRNIGRYAILRELRRDHVSVSYHAVDPVLHREVVLKAVQLPLPSEVEGGREAQISPLEQAFSRQAQAAGKLSHPYIVSVYEAGRVHRIGYLAIERVNGRRLHEMIAGGWRPQFAHAASIAARTADAIEHAHDKHIAHGFLGPQHVILRDEDSMPRIEGFGGWIDDGRAGNEALEHTDRLLPYFDELPEEARRRDVRAVAALLHMMLTGRAPDASNSGIKGQLPPIRLLRPDTPAPLARLIDDTLNESSRNRIRTAGDLRDALTAFIWNDRAAHAVPAGVGLPLAPPAPPETRHVAATDDAAAPAGGEAEPAEQSTQQPSWFARAGFARLPVGTAIALLVAGIVIGVLLGSATQRTVQPDAAPAKASAPSAATTAAVGVVLLDIAPWGEVVVDGRPVGVSPPLTELKLPAGIHALEIRHSGGQAVTAEVKVDPALPQRVRHRFE
jgi:serine/threonine-protein kinase